MLAPGPSTSFWGPGAHRLLNHLPDPWLPLVLLLQICSIDGTGAWTLTAVCCEPSADDLVSAPPSPPKLCCAQGLPPWPGLSTSLPDRCCKTVSLGMGRVICDTGRYRVATVWGDAIGDVRRAVPAGLGRGRRERPWLPCFLAPMRGGDRASSRKTAAEWGVSLELLPDVLL